MRRRSGRKRSRKEKKKKKDHHQKKTETIRGTLKSNQPTNPNRPKPTKSKLTTSNLKRLGPPSPRGGCRLRCSRQLGLEDVGL